MKFLKQVALVSAVAAASGSAFALEALDDKELSEKTGQDGLTITIKPSDAGIRISKLYIHDNDGLATKANATFGQFKGANAGGAATPDNDLGGTGNAGALVVYGTDAVAASGGNPAVPAGGAVDKAGTATNKAMIIQGGNITIDVDTDAGNGSLATANNAFVNARIKMEGDTHIGIGKVGVGTSDAIVNDANGDPVPFTGVNTRELLSSGGTTQTPNQILGAMSVKLSGSEMNVQLGSQPQGAMVIMNSTIDGGLELNNLEVVDNNGYQGSSTLRPLSPTVTSGVLQDATGVVGSSVVTTNGTPAAGLTAPTADTVGTTAGGQKGSLLVKKIHISDYDTTANATAKLSLQATVDIDQRDGIVMSMKDANPEGMYIYMTDVGIGDGNGKFAQYHRTANSTTTSTVVGTPTDNYTKTNTVYDFANVTNSIIGDVEIVGLTTGGSTISIAGH